jgi:hypothetical protein
MGKKYPSFAIAHIIHMKESYGSMHHLVKHNKYNKYSWHMCGYLKVIIHLLDL